MSVKKATKKATKKAPVKKAMKKDDSQESDAQIFTAQAKSRRYAAVHRPGLTISNTSTIRDVGESSRNT